MAGHLDLILKAAKLNPSTETSKSADASHLLTDSESAVASEQESSDGGKCAIMCIMQEVCPRKGAHRLLVD